ncbi:MAG: hypothetical protein CFE31_19300 [Rhizobiales bacterium PAR1]|nr:MAG: hypothetical protein CFE31_19300 [Rhizobiales bacterium PAR1]
MPTPDLPPQTLAPIALPALSPDLLERPLDYFMADHDRQRAVCAYLKQAVRLERIDRVSARAISGFLAGDLKQHFDDERLSLYPALLSRSTDDVEFSLSIRHIERLHAGSEGMVDYLIEHLQRLAKRNVTHLSPEFSELLLEYARQEQQSLAFENSVILAIAGVRLKKSDLGRISADMKARRGMVVP